MDEKQNPYKKLSKRLQAQIKADQSEHRLSPWRTRDTAVIRRNPERDHASLWRPAFVRDVEKILHSAYYNRYSDKTQVFSLYRNDDLTRRALHVQLVSRSARTIGSVLGLNVDLIEAISLGHDIGHTPFGHAGEKFLSDLYHQRTGRYFCHNVHSARVLDGIFNYNLSLQTLDGILCHNGEFAKSVFQPAQMGSFSYFDQLREQCYTQEDQTDELVASTLEGCVVRICDMIAYLGKDRQDVARIVDKDALPDYDQRELGANNATIINNLTVDIIENSYGKNYLGMSEEAFQELEAIKRENYELVYMNPDVNRFSERRIRPMFAAIYERLISDLEKEDQTSYIWRHHIRFVERLRKFYDGKELYHKVTPIDQIVVDYIASMTDDYFVDLFRHLFPNEDPGINYIPYFKEAPQLSLEV
jgi:dGTPase